MTKEKQRYQTVDAKGQTYELIDVSGDRTWRNVLAVETHRGKDGKTMTVINHRIKDFATRRGELALGRF